MKLSLQLKLGQQLTMTPQLQQAIRLLQLSTLDLQQEIHQVLESNPMLELIENSEEDEQISSREPNIPSLDRLEPQNNRSVSEEQSLNGENANWEEQIPTELATDSHWDDVYPDTYSSRSSYTIDPSDYEYRNTAIDTLQDHLLWQLNLTPMSEKDQSIGVTIIDAIDPNGALTMDIESIHTSLEAEFDVELDEVIAVLHRIQRFDPVGVGYRDLAECLLIQLNQYEGPTHTERIEHAKNIVTEHIALLGKKDFDQLGRKTKLKKTELKEAIAIIESLDPRPGANISPPSTTYVVPDVFVTKQTESGKWKVELNPDTTPKIRINDDNASLIKRPSSKQDTNYLKDNLQEARWFIKSLESRNDTLLKVATCIVEYQEEFLEYGEEAMKPLVLQNIAEAVNMHESTISRVTTQKYMHTPRGILKLKYFFSSHVSTEGGGERSSTAIRAIVKKLIAAENTLKPLSDNKITQLLEEKGINVARRTIAKYRESLSIPPSNERKRLVE